VASLVAVLTNPVNDQIGAVTGRLIKPQQSGDRRLDAAGMILRSTWRHLDRGSEEHDVGQYREPESVFGGTGASTLFRRTALEDVAVDGEVFLAEFHSYREDAELSFRLRERGWVTAYEPAAECVHDRKNLPERRREMSELINYHSLKNRYLLRAYHETLATFLITLVPSLVRELGIGLYVLTRERSSLRAFGWLWENRQRILARRRAIQSRRTVSRWSIARWFLIESRPL
jgi:GT2 family glycosyltransferase